LSDFLRDHRGESCISKNNRGSVIIVLLRKRIQDQIYLLFNQNILAQRKGFDGLVGGQIEDNVLLVFPFYKVGEMGVLDVGRASCV